MTLCMLVIYALQFAFFDPRVEVDLLSWFGIKKSASKPIYGQVIPLFLLLALCALQKASLKVEQLVARSEETYGMVQTSFQPEPRRSEGSQEN